MKKFDEICLVKDKWHSLSLHWNIPFSAVYPSVLHPPCRQGGYSTVKWKEGGFPSPGPEAIKNWGESLPYHRQAICIPKHWSFLVPILFLWHTFWWNFLSFVSEVVIPKMLPHKPLHKEQIIGIARERPGGHQPPLNSVCPAWWLCHLTSNGLMNSPYYMNQTRLYWIYSARRTSSSTGMWLCI